MKRTRLNALQRRFASAALLVMVMSVPLSWPAVANADLFSELKKVVEKVVKEELEKAIEETPEQPSAQENSKYVGQVQYFLHLLGYDIGTMTGYMTPETSSAIRAFQADQGLPVDGLVTETLALALAVSFQEALLTGVQSGAASSQTTTSPPATATQTTPNGGPTADILSPPADQSAETVQSSPAMVNITTDTQPPLTHVINTGQGEPLIGAQNVLVNGTLYDVTFMKGTCVELFDGCDEVTDFMINDAATARAAAEALLDQVFVAGYDSNPDHTYGCFIFRRKPKYSCTVHVPYRSNVTGGFGNVITGVAINWNVETMDRAAGSDVWASKVYIWARFVLADKSRAMVTGERPGLSGTGSAVPASQVSSTASSQTTTSPPVPGTRTVEVLPLSRAGAIVMASSPTASATPTSTPTHDQAVTSTNVAVAGLTIPEHWTTIENGIVVPHPVKKDGRVLTNIAISHYATFMGFTAGVEAGYALTAYMLLVALRENSGVIDLYTVRYAKFLTDNERSRYLCWEKSSNCNSVSGEITWTGSNEFETRRSRQSFIDDYRDRLVAVGAKQPIDFLDVGLIEFSQYDQAKRGFSLTSKRYNLYNTKKTGIWFNLLSGRFGRVPRYYDEKDDINKGKLGTARNIPMTFSYDPAPEKDKTQAFLSEFKPMSESDAASLVNRHWHGVPPGARTAPVVLHQTLTEFRARSGKFVVTAAVAYEDLLFKRELHRFSLGNSAPAPVAVAASSGGPAVDAVKALPVSRITDGVQQVSLPRLRGDLAVTIDSTVLSREELIYRPDYHKHLAFAYLGKHPDILDHSPVAQGVAMLYLTNDAKIQYLNISGAPPFPYYSWKGENEFYQERISQTFVDDYRSSLVEAAPKFPFDIWVIEEAPLRQYDFNRVGYDLLTPRVTHRAKVGYKGENYQKEIPKLGVVSFDTSNFNPIVPDLMPMDAARAEDLANKLVIRNNQRQVYYGARLRIKDVVLNESFGRQLARLKKNRDELPRFDLWQFEAIAEIKSLGIYVDPELTQLIYQFDLSK